MERGDTIRCKHCGTEFINLTGFGFMGFNRNKGFYHIETEIAMRCPQCMKRINNSAEEFNSQIVGTLVWK